MTSPRPGRRSLPNRLGRPPAKPTLGNTSGVNLGLWVPITEHLDRARKMAQLTRQQQANRLRYDHERNKNRLAYSAALRDADQVEKNYGRARENYQLGEKNLRLAEQQFASGRLPLTELNSEQYAYEREKNNYLQMAYNYLSAQLTLNIVSRY